MSFAAPWLLAALAVLPLLWWLLRVTPPPARRQDFPAIGLLLGLQSPRTTAARTPWWLLALRLVAAALVIVGLAGPVRHAPVVAVGASDLPVLLVIDDGWAAAPDWADRLRAADAAVAALPGGTPARLLATAADAGNTAPDAGPVMPVSDLAGRLGALHPLPWPPDRAAAAAALRRLPAAMQVVYVADGVATVGDAGFVAALARFARVTELRGERSPGLVRPPRQDPDGFGLRVETLAGTPESVVVRAVAADDGTVAETPVAIAADGSGRADLVLPADLLGHVVALRLAGVASAGAVVLLDARSRRHPVGLLTSFGTQDQPLTGALYFVRRALAASTDLRDGGLSQLLARPLAVIMVADQAIGDPATLAGLTAWVRQGGTLIRFAGPILAAANLPDALLPVTLVAGDRALGGAMSWSRPAALAAFPQASPFAGLAIPDEVRVTRQVLAEPTDTRSETWASLADGTPLVTAAPLGAGRIVLFHVTANADWSNLPLSGLFVDMLHRLVELSAGVAPAQATAPLVPRRVLDGSGQFTDPGPAARPVDPAALSTTAASPLHPPGLYGTDDALRALNLSATLPPLVAENSSPNARRGGLATLPRARAYGPDLLAAALVLILADLLIALRLRGLVFAAVLLKFGIAAHAGPPDMPSLATHLAYVVTGDTQADGISGAGLQGLSDAVNARTAAVLAEPVGVDPARDDLSFYPLLYWPILADAPDPDGATIARLDAYMADGGIIVFDTRDAGAADAQADAALRRIAGNLAIPPLTPLTPGHVLSHSFYLLRDWPGRFAGSEVWVDRRHDPANDGVSPVVIGANDWAAAWATDASGANPYDVAGGEQQRQLAYRFGVNLVIYALTGNYKADQVHVPDLLRRMGTDRLDQPDPDAPP